MMLLTATPMPAATPNAAIPVSRTDTSSPASGLGGPADATDKSPAFSDSLAQSVARQSMTEGKPAEAKTHPGRGTAKAERGDKGEEPAPVTEQDLASQVIGWAEHMAARRDAQALTARADGHARPATDRRAIGTQPVPGDPLAADGPTGFAQDRSALAALLGQTDSETSTANPIASTERRGTKGTRPTSASERHFAGQARKNGDTATGHAQQAGAATDIGSTDIRLAANKPLATQAVRQRSSLPTPHEPSGAPGASVFTTTPFAQMLNETTTDIAPRGAHLGVPVGHPQWGHGLGQQLVAWSQHARSGEMKAELRLDPPDLGPMRVALTITDGVASASFVSAHAAVRTALEQAMPQLHAALATSGISLGQTHVGENGTGAFGHSAQDQGSGAGRQPSGSDTQASQATGIALSADAGARPAQPGHGLLDVFA